jgi:DNA-directed RNA polymerase specialized sigma24 family protein
MTGPAATPTATTTTSTASTASTSSQAPPVSPTPRGSRSRAMLVRALQPDVLVPAQRSEAPGITPESAFDALYVYAAPGILQQARLLSGNRQLAVESVTFAFRRAWQCWPEVARDPDPVGWVRAAAHSYALSPWHRLRHVTGVRPEGSPLLALPPHRRRAVLLHEALGLDIAEIAAETEAGPGATTARLHHARAALGGRTDALASWLADEPDTVTDQPQDVRAAAERDAVVLTRTVWSVLAGLALLVTVVSLTAPH